jgi:transposase-like protein
METKKQRKSGKFKTEVVMELLRGKSMKDLSREKSVTITEISHWRDEFIQAEMDGFKKDPGEVKLAKAER